MGRVSRFTEAGIRRYIKAARAEDPRAVVEIVTDAGVIRILPDQPRQPPKQNEVDAWFANDEG